MAKKMGLLRLQLKRQPQVLLTISQTINFIWKKALICLVPNAFPRVDAPADAALNVVIGGKAAFTLDLHITGEHFDDCPAVGANFFF